MKKSRLIILFLLLTLSIVADDNSQKNIGLLVMATGKYISFIQPLIDSARKFFCTNHNITYFVFTDGTLSESKDTVVIHQTRMGWPFDTMLRCAVYANHKEILTKQDYLFAIDADMLFVDSVGEEILSNRVATFSPGYYRQKGPYERRSFSTAHIHPSQGRYYFAGAFYGGQAAEFITINEFLTNNIKIDMQNRIIAVCNDESHLNKYFVLYPPTLILTPDYCYPQSFPKEQVWLNQFKPKLLALDKNHAEMRK